MAVFIISWRCTISCIAAVINLSLSACPGYTAHTYNSFANAHKKKRVVPALLYKLKSALHQKNDFYFATVLYIYYIHSTERLSRVFNVNVVCAHGVFFYYYAAFVSIFSNSKQDHFVFFIKNFCDFICFFEDQGMYVVPDAP